MTLHRSGLLALLALACTDGKTPNEPNALPSTDPTALKALPSAPRALTSAMVRRIETVTMMASSGPAQHNPRSQAGSIIQCFSGTDDGDQGGITYGGTCRRMEPTRDGAELRTNDGDENGSYAGVYATPVNIRGKRLGDVIELRYSYAGGSFAGGSPRWSVAIDENGNARHEGPVDEDAVPGDDDGFFESYAFADIVSCNDGDTSVGTSDAEDDGTCTWYYETESFPNWDSFAGAHPNYRIARLHSDGSTGFIPAFVVQDQPAHYIVWGFEVR